MDIDPSSPPIVKEFRFYPESKIVTIVFGDDKAEDFMGPENYHLAHSAARHSASAEASNLSLTDQSGKSVIVVVPKGTPHETFDA
jgi:hypothetical protein